MSVQVASTIEEWGAAASRSFVPLSVTSAGNAFTGSIDRREIDGGVTASIVAATACRAERTPRLAAAGANDDLIFAVQLAGQCDVRQFGRAATLARGSGTLYATSARYTLDFPTANTSLILQVPRRRLALADSAVTRSAARIVAADSAPLRVYTAFVRTVFAERPALSGPAAAAMAETAVTLLAQVLVDCLCGSAAERPRDADTALVEIRQHIAQHLSDPALCTPSLARRHQVSVRQLDKLFARIGTSPAAYIRQLRLERAALLLAQSARGLSVADIAILCGFSDATTFTRAFKQKYGLPPGSWRAEQTAATAAGERPPAPTGPAPSL